MDNYELLARVKHEAGTKLLNIGSVLKNIDQALKRNGHENLMISEKYNVSVLDSIETAMNNLEEIHKIFIKYENL
jgi:tRNA (Thr-GGU) A37 N-methylase